MVEVTIHKPLFGMYVNIRDTYLKAAIKEKSLLKITIPQGTALVDPRKWMDGKYGGKRVEQVFKIPNVPLVLYGGFVPLKLEEKPLENIIKQQSLL